MTRFLVCRSGDHVCMRLQIQSKVDYKQLSADPWKIVGKRDDINVLSPRTASEARGRCRRCVSYVASSFTPPHSIRVPKKSSKQQFRAMTSRQALKQQINVGQAQGSRINMGGKKKRSKGKTLVGPPQSSKLGQSAEQPSKNKSPELDLQDSYPVDYDPFDAQFVNPEVPYIPRKPGRVSCDSNVYIYVFIRTAIQSQSEYMSEWLERRSQFLHVILENECPSEHLLCSICSSAERLYRCKACFGTPILCPEHLRETHEKLPFHRVEKWTGQFFEDAWLSDVGFVLHLGHEGEACPNGAYGDWSDIPDSELESFGDDENDLDAPVAEPTKSATVESQKEGRCSVVDSTGVHLLNVAYCACENPTEKVYQMLELKLWPASFDKIKTAFTFRVLSQFRIENLECHTSTYQFYRMIRRLTNRSFPDTVAVSFRSVLLENG